MYITIRKKYLKDPSSAEAAPVIPELNSAETPMSDELWKSRCEALENENNFVKFEYQKLLGHLQHYESETERLKIELENSHNDEKKSSETLKAAEKFSTKLKTEVAQNGTKYENACQEIKKLKVEIDSIKKG